MSRAGTYVLVSRRITLALLYVRSLLRIPHAKLLCERVHRLRVVEHSLFETKVYLTQSNDADSICKSAIEVTCHLLEYILVGRAFLRRRHPIVDVVKGIRKSWRDGIN